MPAIVGLVDVYAPPLAGARPAVDGFLPTRARGSSLSGGTFDLGTVVRLAGDVTANGEVSGCPAININDLSAIAGTLYDNVCDAAHDLNGSGGADCDDIFDLALAAANYGERGYVDWLTGTVDNCQ